MRRSILALFLAIGLVGLAAPQGAQAAPQQAVQAETRLHEENLVRVSAPRRGLFDILMALYQRRQVLRMLALQGIRPVKVPLQVKLRWYWHNAGAKGTLAALPFLLLGLAVMPGNALALPKNDVYAGGNWHREACVVQMKVKTATNLRSGKGLIRDTTDFEVSVAGAGAVNVLGWLTQRNWTQPDWDHTTAPAANDLVDVLLALPGVIANVRNGANLTQGDQAIMKAAGVLDVFPAMPAAGDSRKIVGRVLRTSDGSGADTDALVVVK